MEYFGGLVGLGSNLFILGWISWAVLTPVGCGWNCSTTLRCFSSRLYHASNYSRGLLGTQRENFLVLCDIDASIVILIMILTFFWFVALIFPAARSRAARTIFRSFTPGGDSTGTLWSSHTLICYCVCGSIGSQWAGSLGNSHGRLPRGPNNDTL